MSWIYRYTIYHCTVQYMSHNQYCGTVYAMQWILWYIYMSYHEYSSTACMYATLRT